ncbi:Bombesin receptor subtype-3 [Trichoplax sp. H2]|nr:Bombesin receptor subtype-3 [Trichoplax sp. H2]|eukprot:RDD39714.1 Bombesin receptor subtype-3 [Trichoplax sp. H2]
MQVNTSDHNNSLQEFYSTIYVYSSAAATCLGIIGLSANLFLLYLLVTDKFFHKTTYYLIMVSSTSDSISTITSILGFAHIASYTKDYHVAVTLCRSVFFITLTSYGISMMNLCLIGIERYFAIVKPFVQFYRNYKIRIITSVEILIWTSSIIFTIPTLVVTQIHQEDTFMCEQGEVIPLLSVYFIVFTLIMYVIPCSVIIITYGLIINYQKNYVRPGYSVNYSIRNVKNRKFVKMLKSIALFYVFTTWPYFATLVGFAFTREELLELRNRSVFQFLLAFFSYSVTTSITIVSPFIYFKFDVNIRKRSAIIWQRVGFTGKNKNSAIIHLHIKSTSKPSISSPIIVSNHRLPKSV